MKNNLFKHLAYYGKLYSLAIMLGWIVLLSTLLVANPEILGFQVGMALLMSSCISLSLTLIYF
jgi:hypothetical protein